MVEAFTPDFYLTDYDLFIELTTLRQSLIMSQGSLLILFQRPISGLISAVALLFFALPVINPSIRRARAGKPPVEVATRHDD